MLEIKNVNVDWFEINSTHCFDENILNKIYDEKLNIQKLNIQEKVLEFDFFNFNNVQSLKFKDFLNKCDLKVCKQATSYYNIQLKISDFFTIFMQSNESKLNNNYLKNIKLIANSILNLYFSFEEIKEMSLIILKLFKADIDNLNLSRVDYCIDTIIDYSSFKSLINDKAYNLRTKRKVSISHFFQEENFTGIAYKFTTSKYFRVYDKLQEAIEKDIYSQKENLYFKKYLNINTILILRDDYNSDLNKYYRELLKENDIDLYLRIEKTNEIFTNYELLNRIYRLIYKNNRVVRFEYEMKKDALNRINLNTVTLREIKYLVIENLISATAVSVSLEEAKKNMEYFVSRTEKSIYEKIKSLKFKFNNEIYNIIFKEDDINFNYEKLIFKIKYLVEFTQEKLRKSFKRIKSSVKNHFIRLEAVKNLVSNKSDFISYFIDLKNEILNFNLEDYGIYIDENNNIFTYNNENNVVYQEIHSKNFKIELNDLSDLIYNNDFYIDCDENFNVLYQI
jgi:hypothetical protein